MSSGCVHYIRRCSLLAPCCKKYYNCRLCHNDKEDHELDRRTVEALKCLQCDSSQEVNSHCKDCGIKFGRYYCEICRLFDDTEKGQFHCSGCGICRVGGVENFFHCDRCDMCLGIQLKDSHKCVEKSSRSDCPICYEDIHTSRIPSHVPPCGHLLHSSCFTKLLESGGYACPICSKSLIDMTRMWRTLDLEISHTPMPEEYKEFYVLVLCRDCNKESKVKFHVLGLKCMHCGSYNTSREGEEGVPVVPRPATAGPAADNEEGWETEEEEEIVGGEEEPAANGNETQQQPQDDSISDELNIADVVLDVDGDRDNVLPLD